jgi:hypothetical protein
MGRKNSEASEGSSESSEELSMAERVEAKIRELGSLSEKVHAIAINRQLIEKRALDAKLEAEVTRREVVRRRDYAPLLEEVFAIAGGLRDLSDADLDGVEQLLTEEERAQKHNYYARRPIDDYWLKAFRASDVLAESVHADDEPLLRHLSRIDATKAEDGSTLSVTFHFSENEWFSNATLRKEFAV